MKKGKLYTSTDNFFITDITKQVSILMEKSDVIVIDDIGVYKPEVEDFRIYFNVSKIDPLDSGRYIPIFYLWGDDFDKKFRKGAIFDFKRKVLEQERKKKLSCLRRIY